ncbi:MAG: TRAP transporter permease [Gammaproteobacteria bacterium]|nr:TRAP transporter permease [Gammaproteobacteria bacterium]
MSIVLDRGEAYAQQLLEEVETGVRHPVDRVGKWIIPTIAILWSLFQLALPKFILLEAVHVRTIHLTFAIVLAFLCFPTLRSQKKYFRYLAAKDRLHTLDYILALIAGCAAIYLSFDYSNIIERSGLPLTRDLVIGVVLIVFLVEASRRTLGFALPCVVTFFTAYAFFGAYMPEVIAFKGVSARRFVEQVVTSTQGIYGVPLDVSANIVFLFVLFGALLEKAGGGKYFVDLAFSIMGGFKGGPAKAAVLASACTGMISGSSIANTVTAGTFTIPVMKRAGMPAHKAAAVEVAAGTNGQIMPPVMGAAAFIMAEYVNMPYAELIVHAFLPASVAYIGLFYVVHLEANKLGLRGLSREERPYFFKTLIRGLHYLIPIGFLLYQLMILRHSPQLSVFYAIVALTGITILQEFRKAFKEKRALWLGVRDGILLINSGLIAGARNMIGIGIATATAGIVIAVVTLGLGGLIGELVAMLSGGNLLLLLMITAAASLVLGMGLPTTANYIVMAALTAPLIVELGGEMGLIVPLVAAHLFVFYFGILADVTPPVGLASFAGSAIAKADYWKTGIQAFFYDIRTAIMPFMFIFNTELLLFGIKSFWQGLLVFVGAAFGMLAFAGATQRWVRDKNRWYETLLLLLVSITLFRPTVLQNIIHFNHPYWSYPIAMGVFAMLYCLQRQRALKKSLHQKHTG